MIVHPVTQIFILYKPIFIYHLKYSDVLLKASRNLSLLLLILQASLPFLQSNPLSPRGCFSAVYLTSCLLKQHGYSPRS